MAPTAIADRELSPIVDSSPEPSSTTTSVAYDSSAPSPSSCADSASAAADQASSQADTVKTTRRSKSDGATGVHEAREKRRRSRVTPEQLVHLERFFASDRSPTAARRKEISDLLGMQERQTQIWFQNR